MSIANSTQKINTLPYLVQIMFFGLSSSFFSPLQSAFFVNEMHLNPGIVGSYLACSTLVALLVSQWIGWLSDKGIDRLKIVKLSAICGLSGFLVYSCISNTWILMGTGLTFISLAACGSNQVFALAKESNIENSEMLVSYMRSLISFAWVIGPPIAFWLYDFYGIRNAFFIVAVMYGVIILFARHPSKQNIVSTEEKTRDFKALPWTKLYQPTLVMLLLYVAINSYIVLMPLYVVQKNLPSWLPGVLFGLAAACEIPLIIISSKISKKVSYKKQLFIAVICGILYYSIFPLVDNLVLIFAVQILNALCVALSASAGLQVFQAILPDRLGYATTLYSNSIACGVAIGALLGGWIASVWSYTLAIQIGAVYCLLALLVLSASIKSRLKKYKQNLKETKETLTTHGGK